MKKKSQNKNRSVRTTAQPLLKAGRGMSLIVKTVTRLVSGLLFLYGFNLVLHGHNMPGGGIAGGGFIAMSFLNLIVAFGKDTALEKLSRDRACFLAFLGMAVFLLLGMPGINKGYFFSNFIKINASFFAFNSSVMIILCNIALSLLIGAGLFAVFVCLILLRIDGDEK